MHPTAVTMNGSTLSETSYQYGNAGRTTTVKAANAWDQVYSTARAHHPRSASLQYTIDPYHHVTYPIAQNTHSLPMDASQPNYSVQLDVILQGTTNHHALRAYFYLHLNVLPRSQATKRPAQTRGRHYQPGTEYGEEGIAKVRTP